MATLFSRGRPVPLRNMHQQALSLLDCKGPHVNSKVLVMLDLIFVLAFVTGLAWIAARAFKRPDGVYRKSLLGFLCAVAFAAAVWFCA